ncbi:MAG TPA: TonB-dependent receptor plug domain-containing protein [Croceibacterium sp.]|nr:TonB-dependent receptor plug domain-containing protein [Solirubrobacterales bacterium]HYD24735.1 TonB-dependent receptor plug domain-containing protein [Croceibacterium sp.]
MSSPAWAQAETGDAPPPTPVETVSAAGAGKQVYTAADFARFAPKTAYDMLVQVPGFTIRGADQERGLGQASENVLINGQRIANKQGGAIDELQRIPVANVERIEIVDAASLGIAGLSGQVANIVLAESKGSSGQFEWRPDFRAHFSKPNLFRGSISYSGEAGFVDYTLSIRNQAGRGAFGGPIVITDPAGVVTEQREQRYHSESDLVTFQTKFALDGPGSSEANLTLAYTPYWAPVYDFETRTRLDGDDRTRLTEQTLDGWYIDISGDYTFPVGPGRMKLIGLRHFDREPVDVVQVTRFASGAPDEGIRFLRDSRIGETVLRGEYGWRGGKNDWQVSLERAYNSLDQRGSLYTLGTGGEFEPVAFPEGSGHVVETRYEGIVTFSRPLGSKVDLQIAAGAEHSELGRLDGDVPARTFIRPKGSVTLGWRPGTGWDASLKLRRRVGQISFYDFLAQPNLQQERENTGNPDLVPPQSWEVETEVGRQLGAWGKTRVRLYYHLITDIIDVIPIGEDGEAIGNLPSAKRMGGELTSTIQLDPIGLKGAKVDLRAGIDHTRVRDPLSGEVRAISGNYDRWFGLDFRHDIPGSDWAWGFDVSHDHFARSFFLTEINRSWEGPVWLGAFVENKDVLGLTVRAGVANLLDARHRFERTVYDGRRLRDPVLYSQVNNQLIGPIFTFLVKGTF